MLFKVVENVSNEIGNSDVIYLSKNSWDDFSFKTTFNAYIYQGGEYQSVGTLKIGTFTSEYNTFNALPKEFEQLDDKLFFSLGQEIDYYTNIKEKCGTSALRQLNDLVITEQYNNEAIRSTHVFNASLNRVFSYQQYFHCLSYLENSNSDLDSFKSKFLFRDEFLEFFVDSSSILPTNTHAIIGNNGIGKSHFLESIVSSYIPDTINTIDSFEGNTFENNEFSRLIYISTSIFGKIYELSEKKEQEEAFYYVGFNEYDEINNKITINSKEKIADKIVRSLKGCVSLGKGYIIEECFELLSFDRQLSKIITNLYECEDITTFKDETWIKNENELKEIFESLSSGHYTTFFILFNLIYLVSEKSLVLIDEPENHLHPPLLSALIRSLNHIFQKKNALGIIATHSPVVLQEIPNFCILKFYTTKVERPSLNTFGENVGILTKDVFKLDSQKSGFLNFIKTLNLEQKESIQDHLGSEALFEVFSRG